MKKYEKPIVIIYNNPMEVNAECHHGNYCSAPAGSC